MRPLIARCHEGLGDLYRHAEVEEMAHENVSKALARYREMGINFWLEKSAVKSH